MVYTERNEKCLSSSSKDKPTSKDYNSSKSGSSGSATAWSGQASSPEKWKYNNMVQNDRDKFNGMHFS
ncbi:hypothetical protein KR059_012563 [Drosophila kikkawai]|nr:hypothetical protein KR059_012563 [Drosophila kikkawai]